MHKIKCPACKKGYEITSSQPNIIGHIQAKAKKEAFLHYLGLGTETVHIDYLKERMVIIPADKIIYKDKL